MCRVKLDQLESLAPQDLLVSQETLEGLEMQARRGLQDHQDLRERLAYQDSLECLGFLEREDCQDCL